MRTTTKILRRRHSYANSINKNLLILVMMMLGMGFHMHCSIEISAETNVRQSTSTRQSTRKLPPPVRLNKCCPLSEHLDMKQNCIAGNPTDWVPTIFLPKNKTILPKGKKLNFMKFIENVRPILNETNRTNDIQRQMPAELPAGCTSSSELEHITGANNIIIFANGSLYLSERAQLIEPRHYCVDYNAALVCFPKSAADIRQKPQIRIRKCCGKHGSYDSATKSCHIMTDIDWKRLKLPLDESIYETWYAFPKCHDNSTSYAIASDFQLKQLNSTDGSIQVHQKLRFNTSDYCLEHLRENLNAASSSTRIKVFTCLHHFSASKSVGGGINSDDAPTGVRNVGSNRILTAALNIGLFVSVFFLAATLVASYLMPSVHHVLHWHCQIFYVFCLFVGDFLLAFSQYTHLLEWGTVQCSLVASLTHFFFLSAFFWLNTMCFNIWWTFRDFRPSSLERNQELLRLRLYSAYAWGIPLVITAIAACIDQIPDTHLLRPEFGVRSCWFSGERLSIFAYLLGPVGILLCANIALFISTTHQLTCGLWKRDDVKSSSASSTALGKVCLKLVVVMGVTWIADIISWQIEGPHTAWFFTDLINALQGVFIFIVVGCQPQVWAACKRFCCPRSRQEITNTTNGGQHSSSSQGLPSLAACGADITQNTSIHGGLNTSTISSTGNGIQTAQQQQQQYLQQKDLQQQQQTKIPMETVC